MFQAKCVLITWTFMALYLFIKWIFGADESPNDFYQNH
ncbi:hypothetical protein BvCmsNSP045_02538 [Escherichia coli]|nr:hypothetical protein BvCmsNSP045_02538 [Escherichia coli]